jgi:hypothetical protein
VVFVTYAVTVTASSPDAATNTAILDAPGHDTAEHSATLVLNPLDVYFPLGLRNQ